MTSVTKAKQAILAYEKALGDPEGLAELSVYYCETSIGFLEQYPASTSDFAGLYTIYDEAIEHAESLPEARDRFLARLKKVKATGLF